MERTKVSAGVKIEYGAEQNINRNGLALNTKLLMNLRLVLVLPLTQTKRYTPVQVSNFIKYRKEAIPALLTN
jgi:hypothetical protein